MLGRASLWALKATIITLPWTWNEISWRDYKNSDLNPNASAATERFVHSVLQDIPQVKDKKVAVRTWPFGVYSTGVCFLERQYKLFVPSLLELKIGLSQVTNANAPESAPFLIDKFSIAHEAGHIANHHTIKLYTLLSTIIAAAVVGNKWLLPRVLFFIPSGVFLSKAYQRHTELEADEFAIKRFSPQEREAIAQWFSDEQFRQLTRDTYSRAMISPSHFAVTIFKLLRSHPDPSVRASHIRQLEQQPPLDKLPTST